MNLEFFWLASDRDFLKKREVLKMNWYDFLETYKNALEKLFLKN